jgi:hypothetical protein
MALGQLLPQCLALAQTPTRRTLDLNRTLVDRQKGPLAVDPLCLYLVYYFNPGRRMIAP